MYVFSTYQCHITGRKKVRITAAAKDFVIFPQLECCKSADMKVLLGQEFSLYKLGN
jgi:hypothetical protein